MKIRDDANPINIRPNRLRIPLLIPPPASSTFYRSRAISYESPFKTSRAPLFEFIFHVSWLIQTRSNHHLQKTWGKEMELLSSFYSIFFHFISCTFILHRRFISYFCLIIFTTLYYIYILFYFFFLSINFFFSLHFFFFYLFICFINFFRIIYYFYIFIL